jgi:hypothetical protein
LSSLQLKVYAQVVLQILFAIIYMSSYVANDTLSGSYFISESGGSSRQVRAAGDEDKIEVTATNARIILTKVGSSPNTPFSD